MYHCSKYSSTAPCGIVVGDVIGDVVDVVGSIIGIIRSCIIRRSHFASLFANRMWWRLFRS